MKNNEVPVPSWLKDALLSCLREEAEFSKKINNLIDSENYTKQIDLINQDLNIYGTALLKTETINGKIKIKRQNPFKAK